MQNILNNSTFEVPFSIHTLLLTPWTLSTASMKFRKTAHPRHAAAVVRSAKFHFVRVFVLFCFVLLVRPDKTAEWFQDHSEDTWGQPAVPSVLSIWKLPGGHRAGGKPGDNQTHCGWNWRKGLKHLITYFIFITFYTSYNLLIKAATLGHFTS